MTLTDLKELATIVGVILATGSLVFAAFNTWLTVRTNRARFWLDLRAAFARHDEIHRKLHPRGDWYGGTRPPTAEEQFQVEAYMGLFEHCEIMLAEQLIDEKTFREIYHYRLQNLVNNQWVRVEKLCKLSGGWKRFIALLARMEIDYECSPESQDNV